MTPTILGTQNKKCVAQQPRQVNIFGRLVAMQDCNLWSCITLFCKHFKSVNHRVNRHVNYYQHFLKLSIFVAISHNQFALRFLLQEE